LCITAFWPTRLPQRVMERRTRCEHFLSAAFSIADDLLHRNILLLRANNGHSPAVISRGDQLPNL
jgi:hypothetical protein